MCDRRERGTTAATLGHDPLADNYRTVSRTVHGGNRKAREEFARIVNSAPDGKDEGTRVNVRFLTDRCSEHLERLGRSPQTMSCASDVASVGNDGLPIADREVGPAQKDDRAVHLQGVMPAEGGNDGSLMRLRPVPIQVSPKRPTAEGRS